jgi:predicted metalloprotease with PDZ domain
MVRYRVELADLNAHLLRVTLTLPAPAPDQELMLPVWIPGSYLVREFSRHLSQLVASQGGKPVALTQLDKHRWRAACTGRAALVLSYQVYAFDASVRTAWLDSRRCFFNPASVLLGAVGREAEEHRVALATLPAGWQVATGLPQVGQLEYAAPDYDARVRRRRRLAGLRRCAPAGRHPEDLRRPDRLLARQRRQAALRALRLHALGRR